MPLVQRLASIKSPFCVQTNTPKTENPSAHLSRLPAPRSLRFDPQPRMADSPRRRHLSSPLYNGHSRSRSQSRSISRGRSHSRSPSPGPRLQSRGQSQSRSPSPHPRLSSRGRSQSRSPSRHLRPRSRGRSHSRSPSPRARSLSRSPRARPRSRGRSQSGSPSPRRRYFSRSRSRSGSRSRFDATNPGNTLYVTGLSSRVTERDLEDHFAKEGKVAECRLIVEPRTRISRGFAFITMDTVEDAERCVKYLNHSLLEGRRITVEKSKRKRPRTPTPGNYLGLKNTRDGYRGRYRGGYGREDYGGYRRSPRRSPYRGGRDYSPRRSPYGGRSRRDRSRSLPYSPYRSPDRGSYGRRANVYAR